MFTTRKTIRPLCLLALWHSVGWGQIPEGFEVVELTAAFEPLSVPRINNCGQCVFSRGFLDGPESEVFLYDNGTFTQITQNGVSDALPDVNDSGTLVWMVGYDGFDADDVVMLDQGLLTSIAQGSSPRINNLGHVVFQRLRREGCHNVDGDIYFYNGQTIERVSEGSLSNQSSKINDRDEVVWTRYNFCPPNWISDIMHWSQGQVTRLPSVQPSPRAPNLNDAGLVVWGGPAGVEIWEKGQSRLLSNWGYSTAVNGPGEICINRWHEDVDTWQIWLYRPPDEFLQLTGDPFWNFDGDINERGEVVWGTLDLETWEERVRFMRRIRTGDGDLDGDVDLDDYALFVNCATGPEWVELTHPDPEDSLCECRFMDIDYDGDVDFHDFRLFQLNMGR